MNTDEKAGSTPVLAEGVHARPVGHLLWRHKGKMAAFFLVVMTGVALFLMLSPRTFRSQAKLLVRLGRENVTLDPTTTFGQGPVIAVPASRETDLHSIVESIRSWTILEKVVAALGPDVILGKKPYVVDNAEAQDAPPMPARLPEAAAGKRPEDSAPSLGSEVLTTAQKAERYQAVLRLGRKLIIEPAKKSNVLVLSYEAASPELAQAVVTKLVDYYLDQHLLLHRTPGAHQFFTEQVTRLRAQLAKAEQELRNLKGETGLVALEGQRQLLVARVAKLEEELFQTTSAEASTAAEVRLLQDRLKSLNKTQPTAVAKGVPNKVAESLREQLYALQLKEQEMRGKVADQHPDLLLLHKQILAAKDYLQAEPMTLEQVTDGPNRVYEEVQIALFKQEPALAALQAKRKGIETQLVQERLALKKLNDNGLLLTQLQREVDLHETLYKKYAENLEQAQIDQALRLERITNLGIVQPATHEYKPVRPQTLLTLALGLVAALAGSVALAVTADYVSPAAQARME